MKTQLLVFFVLVGLVSISYAASEHYSRPWENTTWIEENQYAEDFFGIDVLYTEEALTEEQKFLREVIFNDTLPSLHESLEEIRITQVNHEILDAGLEDTEVVAAASYKKSADDLASPVWYDHLGLGIVRIVSYNDYWKATAGHSLLALEGYASTVNQKRAEFEVWREKLDYAGICDENYVGGSIEYCEMPLEDVECNYSEIWEDVPGFTWYYDCVHEHWDAIAALEVKVHGIATSYNETVDLCEESRTEAGERKTTAEEKFSEMEKEELDRIYLSSYGEGNSGALGVKGTYEEILEIRDVSDASYLEAKTQMMGTING